MNKIEKLIAKLCPNGVEFIPLNMLTYNITNIKWSNTKNNKFKYIDLASVNRTTHSIDNTIIIDSETAPSRAQRVVYRKDIIFGTTRPTLLRYCLIPEEYSGQICSTGFCVLRTKPELLLPNYLFHFLGSAAFCNYVATNQRGSNYPSISDKSVRAYRIPIPPLEIQQEIVNILDTFSELEAELKLELNAELEARRKQYQYYRDELLNFSGALSSIHNQIGLTSADKVEFRLLGETASYTRGVSYKKSNEEIGGALRVLRSNNITLESNNLNFIDVKTLSNSVRIREDQWLRPNDILISAASGSKEHVGKVAFIDEEIGYSFGAFMAVVRSKETSCETLNQKFLYYLLSSRIFEKYLETSLKSTTINNLNAGIMKNFRIPIPPLEVQQQIVSILDKFDALVNDLSIGIPAEIAARRKQYEYYRDKLLTFKEAV